ACSRLRFTGVRWKAWNDNSAAKTAGQKKILIRFPHPEDDWIAWRKRRHIARSSGFLGAHKARSSIPYTARNRGEPGEAEEDRACGVIKASEKHAVTAAARTSRSSRSFVTALLLARCNTVTNSVARSFPLDFSSLASSDLHGQSAGSAQPNRGSIDRK